MKKLIQLALVGSVLIGQGLMAHGDVEAGKAKAAACAACHGADGNSMNPAWPKLAGQGAKYIAIQLKHFKSGARKNALMQGQAMALSTQDMQDLGAYYASLTTSPNAANPDTLELGQAIYRGGIMKKNVPACMACHSPDGVGNPSAAFPKLAGQHANYSEAQLKSYRANERDYDSAKIMSGVSERMTDEEIRAVSEYMSGLH